MKVPFFGSKPGDEQRKAILLTLTPEGIKRAEAFDGEGESYHVLAALIQDRPQTIGGIAKSAGVSFGECYKICKDLRNRGLISQVSRQQ